MRLREKGVVSIISHKMEVNLVDDLLNYRVSLITNDIMNLKVNMS